MFVLSFTEEFNFTHKPLLQTLEFMETPILQAPPFPRKKIYMLA